MLGTHLDINKSKVAEEALIKSERMFKALAGAIDGVFWVSDPNISGINYISPAYEKVWGRKIEELQKNPGPFMDFLHPDDRDRVLRLLMAAHDQGSERSVEYSIMALDGTERWILDRGYPILDDSGNLSKMCGIASDITELKKARTARSIFATAVDQVPTDSKPYSNLERVMNAAERSKDMVRQILSFSRRSEPEQKVFDICPLLKEGLKFLRAAIPSTINIQGKLAKGPCRVYADPTQVNQVLMNLCVNASQAMVSSKGAIMVELDHANLKAAFTTIHPPLQPGNHVRLKVSDDGGALRLKYLEKSLTPILPPKPQERVPDWGCPPFTA